MPMRRPENSPGLRDPNRQKQDADDVCGTGWVDHLLIQVALAQPEVSHRLLSAMVVEGEPVI